jgi:arginine utilization protein RocB
MRKPLEGQRMVTPPALQLAVFTTEESTASIAKTEATTIIERRYFIRQTLVASNSYWTCAAIARAERNIPEMDALGKLPSREIRKPY